MSSAHITEMASLLLKQYNGFATGYILALLDEAKSLALEHSCFKPFAPKAEVADDGKKREEAILLEAGRILQERSS